jgi:hypothetical protein
MKKEVSVLLVPLGGEPVMRLIPAHGEGSFEALSDFVGGGVSSEMLVSRLQLIANDNGMRLRLPYNRCGFVGNFLIAKCSTAGNIIHMSDKDIEHAMSWLNRNIHRPPYCHVCGKPGGVTMFCPCRNVLMYCVDCYNQMDPILSGGDDGAMKRFALCPGCRQPPEDLTRKENEIFQIKTGMPADEFEKHGGAWDPDLHFTGSYGDNAEVEAVQSVIDAHREGLIAHFLYSPFPGMFSLELQWSLDHRDNMLACRKAYHDLFTPGGKLKKKHR